MERYKTKLLSFCNAEYTPGVKPYHIDPPIYTAIYRKTDGIQHRLNSKIVSILGYMSEAQGFD